MNIDGLSTAGLEKFIEAGILKDVADIFRLKDHRDEITAMEGLGEKSFEKLIAAVDTARNTTLPRLVNALGIPNVGESNAKVICRHFGYDVGRLANASEEEIAGIDTIGPVIAASVRTWFDDPKNRALLDKILAEVEIEAPPETSVSEETAAQIAGKTFVITGSLEHFGNRKELQEALENAGGKTAGSVSAKTDYLINNDITSSSSKNKKAKELGIPIITEEEAMRMLGM